MSAEHPVLSVTLTYPDQTSLLLEGQGVILMSASEDDDHLTVITGRLTLGNVSQLMGEIVDAFGLEESMLAMSIALLSRHTEPNEE